MASRRALSVFTRRLDSVPLRTALPVREGRGAATAASALHRQPPTARTRPQRRDFTTTIKQLQDDSGQNSSSSAASDLSIPPSTLYSFEDIQSLTSKPEPNRILIDVREPSELAATGKIPGAHNVPVSTSPEAFFLPSEEFEDKFGFARPSADDEVIFYCKAGVRSKAAAQLAGQAGFGGKVGEFPGSWLEWEARGGSVERK